jgi:hypothetical protein
MLQGVHCRFELGPTVNTRLKNFNIIYIYIFIYKYHVFEMTAPIQSPAKWEVRSIATKRTSHLAGVWILHK